MSERHITKTCIVCPMGCELLITLKDSTEVIKVAGNRCNRGEGYAIREITDPRRVLTTTVAVEGAAEPLLPVRTVEAIPKGRLFDAMEVLKSVRVKAPVEAGQVIVENLLNLGVDVVASRDM